MPPNKHAWAGPSSIARILACPPSARFSARFPDSGSGYAQEGTCAHAVAEYLVRRSLGQQADDPRDNLDFYNEEMLGHAEGYVAFIAELLEEAKRTCQDPVVLVEQRVDISSYVPECFGTADCVLIADGQMTIVDFKYGLGVLVSAKENPQLMCYALGALEMFDALYEIDSVRLAVYQPRRENVDVWTLTKTELLDWAENTLKPIAALAYAGEGEFHAGDHCLFCKAKAVCRKRAEYNLELARYDFAPPPSLDSREIAAILSRIDEMLSWAGDVKDYALRQALAGEEYDGFKLVEGRSNRRYVNDETVAAIVSDSGYDPYERKVLGVTAMQKMLGKTRFDELLTGLIEKPQGKPTLVPLTDKRPAINSAKNDFNDMEENENG